MKIGIYYTEKQKLQRKKVFFFFHCSVGRHRPGDRDSVLVLYRAVGHDSMFVAESGAEHVKLAEVSQVLHYHHHNVATSH